MQLDETLWDSLPDARDALVRADQLASTGLLVWRDQWLLSRSDAVVVENGASLEIPLFAALWGIPVVSLSYAPTGMHPWLALASFMTLNSPNSAEHILGALQPQVPETEHQGYEAVKAANLDAQGELFTPSPRSPSIPQGKDTTDSE